MTPLAFEVMQQFGLPRAKRTWTGIDEVRHLLDDFHCFDCSAIADITGEAAYHSNIDNELVFLPAPRTWIEAKDHKTGWRTAILLVQSDGSPNMADIWRLQESRKILSFHEAPLEFRLSGMSAYAEARAPLEDEDGGMTATLVHRALRHDLVLINTPGAVGLTVHDMHKGRRKKLLQLGVGKFPLHAWTEIVIGEPTVDHGGKEIVSKTSDRRPLHFVRSHFKPSLGIRVPAHWRGNAAYGIKQSRYNVKGRVSCD